MLYVHALASGLRGAEDEDPGEEHPTVTGGLYCVWELAELVESPGRHESAASD